jgi:hypothetical protein
MTAIFLIVEPVFLSQLPLVPFQKHQQSKSLGGKTLRCDIHVDFLDGTSSNLPDLLGDLQRQSRYSTRKVVDHNPNPRNSIIKTTPSLQAPKSRALHLLNEAEVVADENAAAVKLVNCASQAIDGLQVQVVRGLVKQQQMRLLCGNPRKGDLMSVMRHSKTRKSEAPLKKRTETE